MATATPESPAPTDTETREAMEFWGYLFKEDKCGTGTLNRLLKGIAIYISTKLSPSACQDLLPTQLADFYRAVGGNYDILFIETPLPSLSFIYKSLGCLHSLQPGESDDGYSGPSVPSLKHQGFVTWQTIQLLLGPEEHVPFLQHAVKVFDIIDPETGSPFPKILPKEAFPGKPDQAMIQWYDDVSERLSHEAQAAQENNGARPEPRRRPGAPGLSGVEAQADDSTDDSADERSQAAKYFSNPFYRDGDGRPRITRRSSKQRPAFSPRESLYERGRGLVHGVRHFISPSYESREERRRKSYPERREQVGVVDGADEDLTPNSLHPGYVPRRERQAAAANAPPRRQQDTPSTELDSSDNDESPGSSRPPSNIPPPHGARPPLHTRRSEEPPLSPRDPRDPRDYFPPQYPHHGRRHSAHSPLYPSSPGNGFGPSESPLFATQVGQLSGRVGLGSPLRPDRDRRDSRDPRDGRDLRDPRDQRDPRDPRDRYDRDHRPERPPAARRSSSEQKFRGRYAGDMPDAYRVQSERERERDRDRQRDRERERERDRRRSRSQGYGSKDRGSKEKDPPRPRLARHVTPVDGVGGRRYVSPVWGNRWEAPGQA